MTHYLIYSIENLLNFCLICIYQNFFFLMIRRRLEEHLITEFVSLNSSFENINIHSTIFLHILLNPKLGYDKKLNKIYVLLIFLFGKIQLTFCLLRKSRNYYAD